jgi:hypothetical protein
MYALLDLNWKPSADSTTPPTGKAPAIVRNDPYDHTLVVTAGWADLGTEEFEAQLRTARLTGSTAGDAAASFDVETEQDGVDLLIHIHLDATVTTALPTAPLFWDCQQVDGSTILAGKAKVLDDVTRFA